MNWKHGYYADSGYTFGYYPETMPLRLRWACLLQGHETPSHNFRYLDAGCGQGLNLILAAAAHPDSRFVGVDFLPEHIAHAQALAKRCGLSNVEFVEGDFVALAKDCDALGKFDVAVCHGISTWVSPEVKQSLFRMIGQVLNPGGVFYNSYNTMPGWLATVPFQHLVLLEQRTKTGALALRNATQAMEQLQHCAPGMFSALPGLEPRLKTLGVQDPVYLVQEYNNQYWNPVFVTEMIDAMAEVKLQYLGTATLPEAFHDGLVNAQTKSLLDSQQDPSIREQLRDFALNQTFRRDLYVKGRRSPWPGRLQAMLREARFLRNWVTAAPSVGEPYLIKAGGMEARGDAAFYGSMIEQIEARPEGCSVEELMASQTEGSGRHAVVQGISLLMHGGWVFPAQDFINRHDTEVARRCNRALAVDAFYGAPYRWMCLPRSGAAMALGDTEMLMLHLHLERLPRADWAAKLLEHLAAGGRTLAKDGKPVTDPVEQQQQLVSSIEVFCRTKLRMLEQLEGI